MLVGDNTIKMLVAAQEGTEKTYAVIVKWAASGNAALSGLTLSQGLLSPAFALNKTVYAASVSSGAYTITVTPVAADSAAPIQVRKNGGAYVSVTSGRSSESLPVGVGPKTLTIVITTQNGAQQTYRLTCSNQLGYGIFGPCLVGRGVDAGFCGGSA
ncbi:hypothetical protein Elgi_67390 [Paenibacillus elgii]|nr:hypothetical protein Elgi_67390 [Paenibacillus elgii]